MNPANIAKALTLAFELLAAAQAAFAQASALIGKARAEGRDITDAELAQLATERRDALDRFRSQIG